MRRLGVVFVALLLLTAGCGVYKPSESLSVVATVFPAYDFARAVCEDEEIHMLLPPGTEIHSFEPSPEDIVKIESADVFIYTGGDSDAWVDKVLNSVDTNDKTIIKMTDYSELIYGHGEEEHTHSTEEADEHGHSHGADEHVWMSPDNAKKIVGVIADALASKNPSSAEGYRKNAEEYAGKITELSESTKELLQNADTRKIVVADRFPLKYFCNYYSLSYVAAFDACDLLADADARTVMELISTVKNENLGAVYYIESGSGYLADTVCRETGAKKLMLNSLHTISQSDFSGGMTYLDVMEYNKEMLKRGLCNADN